LGAHIAYDDILIGIDDPTTKLVTGILPTAADAAVESLGLPQMATSLQPTQLVLGLAVEAERLQALPVARHGDILEAQVDSDRLAGGDGGLHGDPHG
jgi:hypothetical protein